MPAREGRCARRRANANRATLGRSKRIWSEECVGAAVGEEDGAVTEGGVGPEQEGDRGGDLLGGAEAAARDGEVANRVAEDRMIEAALEERRVDGAGRD